MDGNDTRWIQRFDSFRNAMLTIEEVIPRYTELSDLEKDGLIQRFEFTFDLAWKVMQDYLKILGYQEIRGPRPIITQMAQDGYVNAFLWGDMLTARNELSHIYDEDKSRVYVDQIANDFLLALKDFRQKMESKL